LGSLGSRLVTFLRKVFRAPSLNARRFTKRRA